MSGDLESEEWHQQNREFESGNHTVEWVFTPKYLPDGFTNEPGAAWVDQVFVVEAKGPPWIVNQPLNQRAIPGINVDFTVDAGGALPLSYQWSFQGNPLAGQTNPTLRLTAIAPHQAGAYSVWISNALGTVVSSHAVLTLGQPEGEPFQIASLTPANLHTLDYSVPAETAPGGIAASGSRLFYTADDATLRFNLADLSGITTLTQRFNALAGDLRNGKVYCLANRYGPIEALSGAAPRLVSAFLEVNGATGQRTTNRIELSRPISLDYGAAVFAGYGRIVLLPHTGHSGNYDVHRVYDVSLPSGEVLDLGDLWVSIGTVARKWGVAEFHDEALALVCGGRGSVLRIGVPGAQSERTFSVPALYSLDCLTLSLPRNSFYFEGRLGDQSGPRVAGYGDFLYAPWFTGPSRQTTPPALQFTVRAPLGYDVAIECSTNLNTWTTLTNLANPAGTVQFNTPGTGFPPCFYRARIQ